jgi:hypothetical protein
MCCSVVVFSDEVGLQISRARTGIADTAFLARAFHKLLLNFTWWVNRKARTVSVRSQTAG